MNLGRINDYWEEEMIIRRERNCLIERIFQSKSCMHDLVLINQYSNMETIERICAIHPLLAKLGMSALILSVAML